MKRPRRKPRETDPDYGLPGFFFDEADMADLLNAFYRGACPPEESDFECEHCEGVCRPWRSRLDRLDHTDKLQKDRAQLYDAGKREYGNPLLQRFHHDQVAWALDQLAAQPVRRACAEYLGWHEYSLKVLCGVINPAHQFYAFMPEVRDKDKIRAMVVFSRLLAQCLDRLGVPDDSDPQRAELEKLFQQLEK